jgi:hypothetical protein
LIPSSDYLKRNETDFKELARMIMPGEKPPAGSDLLAVDD